MVYMNNSATSFPKPKEVIDALNKYLSNPFQYSTSRSSNIPNNDLLRANIAQFFNIPDYKNLVFTSGSTESLNLALLGMTLNVGDEIITTVTEHNSVRRPLYLLQNRGINITQVRCDDTGYVNPIDIYNSITPQTKMIVINHISNITGVIQDIDAISEIANKYNIIFMVDASQSAGIVPIDVVKSGIDLLAITGHKSLYGIEGVGALYVSPNIKLSPLKVGGTGIHSIDRSHPKEMPMRLEAGTLPMPGIVTLSAGIDYIKSIGWDKIYELKLNVMNRIYAILDKSNIEYIKPDHQHNSYSVVLIKYPSLSPKHLFSYLETNQVLGRTGLHCSPDMFEYIYLNPKVGAVRLSPGLFTSVEDLDYLEYVLSSLP